MGEELKKCMSSYEVVMKFTVVVEGNGDTNDKSIWEGQIIVRVTNVTKI
jgi:hypothetical protein